MQYIGILKHHHERYCMCACGAVRSHPVVLYWHQENPPNVQNNKWEWVELGQYYWLTVLPDNFRKPKKWLLELFGNPKMNFRKLTGSRAVLQVVPTNVWPYKLGNEKMISNQAARRVVLAGMARTSGSQIYLEICLRKLQYLEVGNSD
jgi:hypothetical protein